MAFTHTLSVERTQVQKQYLLYNCVSMKFQDRQNLNDERTQIKVEVVTEVIPSFVN